MTDQITSINWVLLCTILVLLMQVGFLWLETGLIRQKSKVNVAVKNMADFCISAAIFWAVGFGLMFGTTSAGTVGIDNYFFKGDASGAWDQVFFFFQLAFCGTAVTIVSGAIAERVTFRGYVIIATVCAGLVYPVFGHWAWGGLLAGHKAGWLEQMGFIDFAGSTVVHSIGGWVALASAVVIGPRLGRFGRRKGFIKPNDTSLSIAGTFLLWIGWFGFNGGSVLALDSSVPGVLLNTLMAPAAGGLACLSISWVLRGRPSVGDFINGVLAGLVAITANCHIVVIQEAFVIGAIGGAVCYAACRLLERLKIDDAVSAVPVHLAAGIWGTLAVAIFGDLDAFGASVSRLDQFGVQALGVVSAGAYALTVTLPILWFARRFDLLRVSRREELQGLNISEHNEGMPLQDLLQQMEYQARHGDFSRPVKVDADGDASLIAYGYNRVLKRFVREQMEKTQVLEALNEEKMRAEAANVAKSQFLANVSHELRTPLNAILGFSQIINEGAAQNAMSDEEREYLSIINQSGAHLLALVTQVLKFTDIEVDKFDLNETAVRLSEIIEETLAVHRGRIEQMGLTVVRELEDLPDLFADDEAVLQICLNLVSNAIKASKRGGQIRIAGFMTSDGRINIVVEDHGQGIPVHQLARVMEPFDQGVEGKSLSKPDGLGLGLPIARRLAELHGAELFIQSTPQKGTTATVRFPAVRSIRPQNAASRSA